MLNMSNQFYDYLSNKLLNYFEENILRGERYFISFDEEEQVTYFYDTLEKIGNFKGSRSDFEFTHPKSTKKYETFAIEINDIKLVIAESLSIEDSYLNTLRNQLPSQQGDWENTALLIICTDVMDSIEGGAKDLQKEGMPLNVKSISDSLEDEINNSSGLSKPDKQIAKFSLNILEEDFYQTTLWDYETILSIINKGHVSDEDLRELNLFKDEQLHKFSPAQMDKRLRENYDTFNDVNEFSQYGEKKNKLENMFTTTGVNLLNKENWYAVKWKSVKRYKDEFDKQKKPLKYIENSKKISENNLVYWERPSSSKAAGKRKRNIIVFNNNSSSEVSLKFTFDRKLNEKYLNESSKRICKTSGKSLLVNFSLNQNDPTFKSVRYVHRNQNNSAFTFSIVVVNFKPEMINSIKSRYTVNSGKKKIEVTMDEDSYNIEFGFDSSKKIDKIIHEDGEEVYLYDGEIITISDQSPVWVNDKFNFIF